MLEISVKGSVNPRLRSILLEIGPLTRRAIFSAGANGLRLAVRRHLRREGASRHATANRFGATPTQHLIKGAARVTSFSTEHGAIVSVPIAGITRAYRDLEIRPVNRDYLTIPFAADAYGHRVRELRRLGWRIFRPAAKGAKMISAKGESPRRYSGYQNVLRGSRESENKVLYLLRKQVVVRQDRTLLPSDEEIASSINIPMIRTIERRLSAS